MSARCLVCGILNADRPGLPLQVHQALDLPDLPEFLAMLARLDLTGHPAFQALQAPWAFLVSTEALGQTGRQVGVIVANEMTFFCGTTLRLSVAYCLVTWLMQVYHLLCLADATVSSRHQCMTDNDVTQHGAKVPIYTRMRSASAAHSRNTEYCTN